jgi:hypothetical protein
LAEAGKKLIIHNIDIRGKEAYTKWFRVEENKMSFLNSAQLKKLFSNSKAALLNRDYIPVSLIVFPYDSIRRQWLLCELSETNPYRAYGLYISDFTTKLKEFDLRQLVNHPQFGKHLVYDDNFIGQFPISYYQKVLSEYQDNSSELEKLYPSNIVPRYFPFTLNNKLG